MQEVISLKGSEDTSSGPAASIGIAGKHMLKVIELAVKQQGIINKIGFLYHRKIAEQVEK